MSVDYLIDILWIRSVKRAQMKNQLQGSRNQDTEICSSFFWANKQ